MVGTRLCQADDEFVAQPQLMREPSTLRREQRLGLVHLARRQRRHAPLPRESFDRRQLCGAFGRERIDESYICTSVTIIDSALG